MTQIELEPLQIWAHLGIGGIAFVLLPLLLTSQVTCSLSALFTSRWWRDNYVRFLLCFVFVFLILSVYFYLFEIALGVRILVDLLGEELAAPSSDGKPEKLRNLSYAIGALIAVLAGSATIFFSSLRVWINERNTTATEQGLVTERINTATQDLYAMRQRWDGEQNIWEDDITRRNAAIDRLEELANERPNIAPRISRLLSVYVRELSRKEPADIMPDFKAELENELPIPRTPKTEEIVRKVKGWARTRQVKRSDLEKAAQALGRLQEIDSVYKNRIEIDLRLANLQGCDLSGLSFRNGKFSGAQLYGANFKDSDISHADFSYARMQAACLRGSKFSKIDIQSAKMSGTTLPISYYDPEFLWSAQQQGAILTKDQCDLAAQYAGHLDRLEDEAKATFKKG